MRVPFPTFANATFESSQKPGSNMRSWRRLQQAVQDPRVAASGQGSGSAKWFLIRDGHGEGTLKTLKHGQTAAGS